MKHRILSISLFSVIAVAVGMEGLLRLIDPWGAYRYNEDGSRLFSLSVIDADRDYALPPGKYEFTGWSVNIQPNKSRVVPDTNNNAPCTVTAVGDSMTFGYGVSDADTWVNLVAQEMQDVHFINAGFNGYNIESILKLMRLYPADGYIYLLIYNDAEELLDRSVQTESIGRSAVKTYIDWSRFLTESRYALTAPISDEKVKRFFAVFDQVLEYPVMVFAFPNKPGTLENQVLLKYGDRVNLLEPYTGANSVVDSHPNALGHQQIASAMKDDIRQFIHAVCK
jgi:hypothetical protein